jgi:hypothetical protein
MLFKKLWPENVPLSHTLAGQEDMSRLSELRNGKGPLTWRRVVLLGVLLVCAVVVGYKAQRVWRLARSLQGRLESVEAASSSGVDTELGTVGEDLRGAYADMQSLRAELAFLMPVAPYLGWVPVFGGDLAAAPELMDMALAVTEAGSVTFDGLEPLVAWIEQDDPDGQLLAQVSDVLAQAGPNFDAAEDALVVAQERRNAVDEANLSGRVANLVARFDQYLPLLQAALDGGRFIPELLGTLDPRTYLVLVQNNDELRATGGFISAIGLLHLEDGEIDEIVFEDSYAVDDFTHPYPDSPLPVLRYMGIDLWVFRDANWSPDFPTSAQKAIELYQISRELDVDGVLAVDQHALQDIVGAIAPLDVEGWPEPGTGENVASLIRSAWSSPESFSEAETNWWRDRKRFISDLFVALQAKVQETPDQVNWLALARAMMNISDRRHMQVWLADPTQGTAELLSDRGWDGLVRETTSDYLMAIDTNMGFNKVNAIIEENLDYRVLVNADGTAQATLTVRHVNPGSNDEDCDPHPHYGTDYSDLINRCYWNYLRVYVPPDSQLAGITPHPVSASQLITGQSQAGAGESLPEEHGKAVFATFFVLPTGDETETRFVYRLPEDTLEWTDMGWRYRLLVQKQPGTRAVPLRVTLSLPPGSDVQSVSLPGEVHDAATVHQPDPTTVVMETTLERDRVFEVLYRLADDDREETP